MPISLRKFRTGSPRRTIVAEIKDPSRVGRMIAEVVTSKVEAKLRPENGRLVTVASIAMVTNMDMTSAEGGKPILLMKLNASTVPDTPLDSFPDGTIGHARPRAATILAT